MLPLSVDIHEGIPNIDILRRKLNDIRRLPDAARRKSRTPIPPKITLLLTDILTVRELKQLLDAKRPCVLVRNLPRGIRDDGRTPEMHAQNRTIARRQELGDVKVVLAELVVGRCNVVAAELDTGERIEAVEYQPGRASIVVPVLVSGHTPCDGGAM